jgi:flagellar motor switch protein FliM
MEKILSKDEVDSLLEGISGGKVETKVPSGPGGEQLKAYDFTEQVGVVRFNMAVVQTINERFAGLLKRSLSNVTRAGLDVTVSKVESIRFGECLDSIDVPTSLNIFRMEPLKGFGLLIIEGSLVFAFVDTLFGGKVKKHVKPEVRAFTNIETKVIEKIVKIVLGDLEKVWSQFYKVRAVYSRSENDPRFARMAEPGDLFIITRFEINFETGTGEMRLCIPHSLIEPIQENLKSGNQGKGYEVDQNWRKYIQDKLMEMTVNVSCSFARLKMSGRELIGLKVNDVVELDRTVGEPVIICVEGIPKFNGRAGSYNKRQAVKIEEQLIRRE